MDKSSFRNQFVIQQLYISESGGACLSFEVPGMFPIKLDVSKVPGEILALSFNIYEMCGLWRRILANPEVHAFSMPTCEPKNTNKLFVWKCMYVNMSSWQISV